METGIKEPISLSRKVIKSEARETLRDKELNKGVYLLALVTAVVSIVNMATGGVLAIIASAINIVVAIFVVGESLRANRGVKSDLEAYIKETGTDIFKFIGASLLTGLIVAVGTIFFIVPGIIASLCLIFTIHIMIDNPEYTIGQAMKASCELVKGHKGDIFVINLSFLGWIILCGITFGLAGIYVVPYINLTFANYYDKLCELKK